MRAGIRHGGAVRLLSLRGQEVMAMLYTHSIGNQL